MLAVVTGGDNGAVNKPFTSPVTVQLPRSKRMINIACKKAGYQDAAVDIDSKYEASTAGNLLAGGFIGLGVVAMTGALYKYPDTIQVPMVSLNGSSTHGKISFYKTLRIPARRFYRRAIFMP